MKNCLLYLFVFFVLSCKSTTQNSEKINENQHFSQVPFCDSVSTSCSLKKIAEISFLEDTQYLRLNNHPLTKYVDGAYVSNNRLFIVSNSTRCVYNVGLFDSIVFTNEKINSILSNSTYSFAQQIIVDEKFVYVSFQNTALCIEKNGLHKTEIHSNSEINNLAVNRGEIILFTSDSISFFQHNGALIKSYPLLEHLMNKYYNKGDTVYIGGLGTNNRLTLQIYNLLNQKITRTETTIEGISDKSDFFLSDITDSFLVCYPDVIRDRIILVNRYNNKVSKSLRFSNFNFELDLIQDLNGNWYSPTEPEYLYPNFRILANNEKEYFLIYEKNRKCSIYTLSMP